MYKKYIVKKGKKVGPYYYTTVRSKDGKVKTVYIGRSPDARKQRSPQYDNKMLACAVIFFLLGFIFFDSDFASNLFSKMKDLSAGFSSGANLITGRFVAGPMQATAEQVPKQVTAQIEQPNQKPPSLLTGAASLKNITSNETIMNITKSIVEKRLGLLMESSADYALVLPEGSVLLSLRLTGYAEGSGSGYVNLKNLQVASWSFDSIQNISDAASNNSGKGTGLLKKVNVTIQINQSRLDFNRSCAETCKLNIAEGSQILSVNINGIAALFLEAIEVEITSTKPVIAGDIELNPLGTTAATQQKTSKIKGKGILYSALEAIQSDEFNGKDVERGPDWARSCKDGNCALTLFSSPVHVQDIDGLYKPPTAVARLAKLDEKTLGLHYNGYNITITAQDQDAKDLPEISTEVYDNIIDYEFVYRYKLKSASLQPLIHLESDQDMSYSDKIVYTGDIAISFEDTAIVNNFTIVLEKVSKKKVNMRLSKDYGKFNQRLGDEIEIDPHITLALPSGNNTYDGSVTDSGTIDSTSTTMKTGVDCGTASTYRSFIDWNITLVPDNALINMVNLTLNVESLSGGSAGENIINVNKMNNQSQGRAGTSIYADASDPSYNNQTIVSGANSFVLSGTAINDVQANITGSNQLDLGMRTSETGLCGGFSANVLTTKEGATAANRPILAIRYFEGSNFTGTNMRVQTCQSMTFALSPVPDGQCGVTYPQPACGASPNSLLDCDDGNVEALGYGVPSFAGVWTDYNLTSVTDCSKIESVFLCYEEWRASGDTMTNCNITVSGRAGESNHFVVNSSCPGSGANPGMNCNNVTTLENWQCENFFGTNATLPRARARMQVSRSNSGKGTTLSIDALFFNVTYLKDAFPEWLDVQRNTTNVTSGVFVQFNASWIDDRGLHGYIFSINQSLMFVNSSYIRFTGTSNDSINITNISVNPGTNVSWYFYANDTFGHMNQTSIQSFNVTIATASSVDTQPPSWYNVSANETTIFQNMFVRFNATWTDNSGLSTFIFSINQSTEFVNSSAILFSGTWNISSNISQITAPAGTNVSWLFYANDTSNNWNQTIVQTFIVAHNEPNATLIKPRNATFFREVGNITLNGTISDAGGDQMQYVRLYASNLSFPTATFLVQEFVSVPNATSLQYNITSVPIQDENPQSTGALLIFHFDNQSDYGEPQFNVVYDFSGNGLNATLNNNVYPGRGKMAGGLDPSSSALGANVSNQTGSTEYLIGKKNITYLAWVNTTTLVTGTAKAIFDKYSATSTGFSIRQQKTTGSNLQLLFDATAVVVTNFFAAANVWYHLAVVLHAAGTYEVYRDGILFTTGSYTAITANNNHFSVGSVYSGAAHTLSFSGAIDDAAVFNRSFTAEEVNNVARLKSGIYYWYMNMTDNTSTNGASEIRTFIVDRYPNVTSISLTPSPNANTDDQFTCAYTVLDDISASLTGDIKFYNGTAVAETFAGESFTNGTEATMVATLGLQAKNETWRCELSNVADGVAATHGPGDGRNSSAVRTVNSPPNNITLFEPVHGNVTTNVRQRFRWSYVDPDNDPVNFSLNIICYNGTSNAKCPYTGDDRNITIATTSITTNTTTLAANILYYRDDNFYYNWTVNGTDGENATGNARPNNFSEAVVVDFSTYIANVSFGAKNINDFDDTLDEVPLPIKLQNNGNARINIDALFTNPLLFIDPARPVYTYQFAINETTDNIAAGGEGSGTFNFNAINKTRSLTTFQDIGAGTYSAIRFFNFSANSNITAMHINITVPSQEQPGNKNDTIELTASYGGYI